MAGDQDALRSDVPDAAPARWRAASGSGGAFGRRVLFGIKAAVTLGAVILLGRIVDTHVLVTRLAAIAPAVLIAGVALLAAAVVLVAIRWRVIVAALAGTALTLPGRWSFVQMTFAAVLLGQLLPTVAGDGLRVILVRDAGVPMRTAVESTLFDRVVALLALLMLALPAMALSPLLRQTGIRLPATVLVTAALVSLLALVAAPLHRLRWRPIAFVADTLGRLRGLLLDRVHGVRAVALAVAVHALNLLVFVILARGQGLPLGLVDAWAVVPLILLVQMVPLAIGGWGLREGLVVTLLGADGIGPEDALLLSLSFGALSLVAALPGLVTLVRSTATTRPRSARAG